MVVGGSGRRAAGRQGRFVLSNAPPLASLPLMIRRIWALLLATCIGARSTENTAEGNELSGMAKPVSSTATGKNPGSKKHTSRRVRDTWHLLGEDSLSVDEPEQPLHVAGTSRSHRIL